MYGKYGESTKLEFYIYTFSANVNDVFLKSQEGTLCPLKRLNIIAENIMVILPRTIYIKIINTTVNRQ
jgi:hypothetical protein